MRGLRSRDGLGPDRNHGVPRWRKLKTWAAFDVPVALCLRRWIASLANCGCSGCRRAGRMSLRFAAALPEPARSTYEAGPTGFVLAPRLAAAEVDCLVCAPGLVPGLVPREPSDRVNTD